MHCQVQYVLQVCKCGRGRPNKPMWHQHERQGQYLHPCTGNGGRGQGADGTEPSENVPPVRNQQRYQLAEAGWDISKG